MRSSPFIKPFEEEMKNWEAKLVSMNDIIDVWLKVNEKKLVSITVGSSQQGHLEETVGCSNETERREESVGLARPESDYPRSAQRTI